MAHFHGKPKRPLSCQMRVLKEFDPAFSGITSNKSRALILEFSKVLVPYLRQISVDFEFLEIIFKRFLQDLGSKGTGFDIVFQTTSNVSNTSIVQAFKAGNDTDELTSLNIIGSITVTEQVPVTEITSPPASDAPSIGVILLLRNEYMKFIYCTTEYTF